MCVIASAAEIGPTADTTFSVLISAIVYNKSCALNFNFNTNLDLIANIPSSIKVNRFVRLNQTDPISRMDVYTFNQYIIAYICNKSE